MGFFRFVIIIIIFVEIAFAGNVEQTEFKRERALSSLITSVLDQSKKNLHKSERQIFFQPSVASYRQISSSSDSEDSDSSVGVPDIVVYLVSLKKKPSLRIEPEAGQQNVPDDMTMVNKTLNESSSSGTSLTLDITNSTLRKKDKKKKNKKKENTENIDKKENKDNKEKKKMKNENTEEIKESLRSCTSKSIKSCRNACKAALKDACDTYTCKGKFKGTFKKESKKMCKRMFNEPRRPKQRYNSEEEW